MEDSNQDNDAFQMAQRDLSPSGRTYRDGLMPAEFVQGQWGRMVRMILFVWQTAVDCMASNEKHRQKFAIILERRRSRVEEGS